MYVKYVLTQYGNLTCALIHEFGKSRKRQSGVGRRRVELSMQGYGSYITPWSWGKMLTSMHRHASQTVISMN